MKKISTIERKSGITLKKIQDNYGIMKDIDKNSVFNIMTSKYITVHFSLMKDLFNDLTLYFGTSYKASDINNLFEEYNDEVLDGLKPFIINKYKTGGIKDILSEEYVNVEMFLGQLIPESINGVNINKNKFMDTLVLKCVLESYNIELKTQYKDLLQYVKKEKKEMIEKIRMYNTSVN